MPEPTQMPAKVQPVNLYIGDNTTWPTYRFLEDDGITPQDLTGYTWAAQWRPTPDATEFVALSLDLDDIADGRITPYATAAQSAQVGVNGAWDLQSTKAGVVRTWLRGSVIAVRDVTR